MRKHEDNGFYLFRGYLKEKDICGSRIRESWAFLESRKKRTFANSRNEKDQSVKVALHQPVRFGKRKDGINNQKKAFFKNIKKYKKLDEKQ